MKSLAFACLPIALSASKVPVSDEEGLLSLKSQRASLDAGLGLDLMSAATDRNVTQMQALVQSLVEESIKGDGVANMDDDIQQALQIIRSTLLDGIRNTLKTEHKQDQAAIMAQLDCFGTCRSQRRGSEQDCDKHRSAIEVLRKEHVSCRASVKTHYVDKVKKCNELDDWVEAFRLTVKVLEDCVYSAQYECRGKECAQGECEPDIDGRFGGWLKTIITDAKEGYKVWIKLHNECKNSFHAYIDKDSGCDVTQAKFQSKVCELGQCQYTGCQVEYTRCRAGCIAEYHKEVKRVECAEKDRKIDWSATEKIECYIGILLASPTDDELQALCHDDMTNCISTWRTSEYDKCNDVCKEVDFESGSYSQHDRRSSTNGESLYDKRRTDSEAGTDGMAPSTQAARQLEDNEVAGDRTKGVNTTHRGPGEKASRRCTQHLDIDFQPIPCAQPCDDLPDLPCTDKFINAEYSQFLRVVDVSELADKRNCHTGEHTEKWAYNLCDCPTGPNPPVGTYFCPIVGTPSIKKDEYCETSTSKMTKLGNGCCRFDGWSAKNLGMQTEEMCHELCLGDPDCIAADIARPVGEKYHCHTFYGSGANMRTECNTNSEDEVCFIKETHEVVCHDGDHDDSDPCNMKTCFGGRWLIASVACAWPVCPGGVEPVYTEGQCCPGCPEPKPVCEHGTFDDSDPCNFKHCEGGQWVVASVMCDWPVCPGGAEPVTKEGQCCPGCPELPPPPECDEALRGYHHEGYRGCQSQTATGATCQKWTAQSPHGHSRTPSNYPGKGLGDHNYCRNPDHEDTIWCYTTGEERWNFCTPKVKPPQCDETVSGRRESGYRGCQSKSIHGKTCQKWTMQSPHSHSRTASNYPGKGLGDHNYCRNPDDEPEGIWCYTMDRNSRWEYCDPIA